MASFLELLVHTILELLIWLIIAAAVMSWLMAFNVVNDRNPTVRQIERVLSAITNPVLWPLRRFIPPLGSVDITPLIAVIILQVADKSQLIPWLFRPLYLLFGQ